MSDKDLIEEARQEASIHDKLGDGFSEGSEERAFYYEHRDRYKRLADALEAATSERAAALAAVERVRAIHTPTLPGYGPKSCVYDGHAYPCPTIAAHKA